MSDNIEQNDPETEKLLAEMQEQEVGRKQLEKRAKALGVKFQSNTSDKTLIERINEAETALNAAEMAEPPTAPVTNDDFTVKNEGANPHRIGDKTLAHGKAHTLTKPQLSDARIMGRVGHAIKLGILTRV